MVGYDDWLVIIELMVPTITNKSWLDGSNNINHISQQYQTRVVDYCQSIRSKVVVTQNDDVAVENHIIPFALLGWKKRHCVREINTNSWWQKLLPPYRTMKWSWSIHLDDCEYRSAWENNYTDNTKYSKPSTRKRQWLVLLPSWIRIDTAPQKKCDVEQPRTPIGCISSLLRKWSLTMLGIACSCEAIKPKISGRRIQQLSDH